MFYFTLLLGISGRFSPRKASCGRVAPPNLNYLLAWCMQYFCLTTSQAVKPTLLRHTIYMGSLTCVETWVRAVHSEGESDTNKSAQELTRRDTKNLSLSPCPATGSNPRSSDLKSDPASYVPCQYLHYCAAMTSVRYASSVRSSVA